MTVGVLAFHGDFAEHIALLQSMKQKAIEVRSVADLGKVSHLIIPGGESTVMIRFLTETGVGAAIQRRVKEGSLAVYGTCAGAILVARKAMGKNAPRSLGLIDITVDRNAYGTQMQSFQTDIRVKRIAKKLPVAFIRAPVIAKVGKNVEVLAEYDGHPVLVKQGRMLAGTFHPEVRGQNVVHRLFLSI